MSGSNAGCYLHEILTNRVEQLDSAAVNMTVLGHNSVHAMGVKTCACMYIRKPPEVGR